MKKSSMKSQIMVNGHHIRFKVPKKLFDLANHFKRKQFNLSRSIRSYKSNISEFNIDENSTVKY